MYRITKVPMRYLFVLHKWPAVLKKSFTTFLLMNNGEVSQGYVALPVHRQAAEVVATEYYNLNGIRMAGPAYQGITIVKKIYSDGYIKVEKILLNKV